MKIALIFPRYKYPSGDAPLGVAYIASYLRENSDCEVEIIDTTFHKNRNQIVEILQNNDYDIIGISVMTTMLYDAKWIAQIIKEINPLTKVVFGGPHPTIMPIETLENINVDAVCIGEGEQTILELVNNNGDFTDIDGLYYKDGNKKIVKCKPRDPIPDLDTIPFPARDLLPMDKYLNAWFQLDSVSQDLKGINIIASRGCPYQCTYCQPTLSRIFGDKIRQRSAKNIVAELEFLKKNYMINAFMFQDDTLVFDRNWVRQICELMKEKKLDLIWGSNARANLVDEALFSKMEQAGLRKIFMGIESGSQRILDDIYDKRITLEDVKRSVGILKKLGIKVQGYFMIGAPTETEQDIAATIRFAKCLDIDEATFSITTPLPNTYLYLKTKELIIKDISEFDYYKNPVYKGEIKDSRLKSLKRKALFSFYLCPKRIKNTMGSFLSVKGFKTSLIKMKRL